MLAHVYNNIIDRVFGAPAHGQEVVDGLNATDKMFCLMLMTTLQLPGAAGYYKHKGIYSSTVNKDISISREF